MNYQWYPGHMTKARRQMQEDLKLIHLMIELVSTKQILPMRDRTVPGWNISRERDILL